MKNQKFTDFTLDLFSLSTDLKIHIMRSTNDDVLNELRIHFLKNGLEIQKLIGTDIKLIGNISSHDIHETFPLVLNQHENVEISIVVNDNKYIKVYWCINERFLYRKTLIIK